MKPRTAEIVGAGLAGLALATRLAQLGWHVRLHERCNDLRVTGAGIWLWENGLKVLEMLSAFQKATCRARTIKEWRIIDERGRVLLTRPTTNTDRLLLPPRSDLYNALINKAVSSGMDILTSSAVARVRREGTIVTEDGRERSADLVVIADGAYSSLRACIRSRPKIDRCHEGSIRMLIATEPQDPADIVVEYWNGKLRIGYNPCTEDQNYVYLCAPAGDARAQMLPIDLDYWKSKFPLASGLVERLRQPGRWDQFVSVKCARWGEGRVAIIGDAAHAMQPNIGQAANMAFVNAMALASTLDRISDVPSALQAWESQQRPVTEHVQWVSNSYGFVLQQWPGALLPIRSGLVHFLSRKNWFEEFFNRGARLVPEGYRAPRQNLS
jgi:2-polyprenyl-6-methoxyphenol hydroxylase-like FAD-dependent oxidoreductase